MVRVIRLIGTDQSAVLYGIDIAYVVQILGVCRVELDAQAVYLCPVIEEIVVYLRIVQIRVSSSRLQGVYRLAGRVQVADVGLLVPDGEPYHELMAGVQVILQPRVCPECPETLGLSMVQVVVQQRDSGRNAERKQFPYILGVAEE